MKWKCYEKNPLFYKQSIFLKTEINKEIKCQNKIILKSLRNKKPCRNEIELTKI